MTEKELEKYFDRLWPICRSITGDGLRESFRILQEVIPLKLEEIPTGKKVFDWNIPKEWNIRAAYIITPGGKKICRFDVNNLHILNYSIPQDREIFWQELEPHLYYRKDMPEAIPYVTSYYKENWGFCLTYNEFKSLPKKGKYKVYIDSELKKGSLTYGQLVLKGRSHKEILFSSYLCHPSMANNELSGPLAIASLYQKIKAFPNRKYTYRFVIAPETIGIIAFLSKYGAQLKKNVEAGYVLTCCADKGDITFKRSKKHDTLAEKAAIHVLNYSGHKYHVNDFAIGGSDERQYCSPGFDLPVGSFMRTPYHQFKEYHTSLDNKKFISFDKLAHTVSVCFDVVQTLEENCITVNNAPFCEPQLSKRNLYPTTGGTFPDVELPRKILHVLAFSDGKTDLIDIADKRKVSLLSLKEAIEKLVAAGLITRK
jgi:aminopeptidase-like protein